jgi:hypothetical protein
MGLACGQYSSAACEIGDLEDAMGLACGQHSSVACEIGITSHFQAICLRGLVYSCSGLDYKQISQKGYELVNIISNYNMKKGIWSKPNGHNTETSL